MGVLGFHKKTLLKEVLAISECCKDNLQMQFNGKISVSHTEVVGSIPIICSTGDSPVYYKKTSLYVAGKFLIKTYRKQILEQRLSRVRCFKVMHLQLKDSNRVKNGKDGRVSIIEGVNGTLYGANYSSKVSSVILLEYKLK